MVTIDPATQQAAEQIHHGFETTEKVLLGDGSLDELTRRQRIQAARAAANTKLAALRRQVSAGPEGERDQLMAKLLRPSVTGSSSVERVGVDASFRDALDRASKAGQWTGDGQLAALYRRAQQVGDDLLARGCLVEAFNRPDRSVLNAYAADHPSEAADISRLSELVYGTSTKESVAATLQIQMLIRDC